MQVRVVTLLVLALALSQHQSSAQRRDEEEEPVGKLRSYEENSPHVGGKTQEDQAHKMKISEQEKRFDTEMGGEEALDFPTGPAAKRNSFSEVNREDIGVHDQQNDGLYSLESEPRADIEEASMKPGEELQQASKMASQLEDVQASESHKTETKTKQETTKPPNIVLIVADDVGMGDLGCFGNTTIKTPNIDRLASEGTILRHHIAAASVCTPSRAALMTGRYPVRTGMAPSNIVRVNMFVAATGGLPPNEITIAELAKTKGYATGLVGKWHLGVHCGEEDYCHYPLKQGFDHYYGLPLTNLKDYKGDGSTVTKSRIPDIDSILLAAAIIGISIALYLRQWIGNMAAAILIVLSILIPALVYWTYNNLTIFNAVLMRNYEVVEQPLRLNNRLAARMVREGVSFIEKQKTDDKPFLLVMSWIQAHTALHTSPEFTGVSAHGRYGDNVEEMDWSVGQIIQSLNDNGFKDNTFVYFTSDNGGHKEETGKDGQREGGWNGIYRGGKMMGGMDGGIRVPTVVRFPDRVPAGKIIDHPTSQMDIFPTIAELMGADVPTDRLIDGENINSLLKGDSDNPPHDFMFHYCGVDIHAARYSPNDGTGDVWKVHYATPNWKAGTETCLFVCDCYWNAVTRHDPPLLYNIAKDPSEREQLDAEDKKHSLIIDLIDAAVAKHRTSVTKVEDQMTPWKLLPIPKLQPCCGGTFPRCDCSEPEM